MDLNPYVDALRADLETAAAAGGDEARDTARLLGAALDASLRLCLVDALSALAAEVTAVAAATAVEIRMHGREPQVVVTSTEPEAPAEPVAAPPTDDVEADDGGGTARLTLRLPEALKAQAEVLAAAQGLSVNSWVVRSVAAAVGRPEPRGADRTVLGGRRLTGYARS